MHPNPNLVCAPKPQPGLLLCCSFASSSGELERHFWELCENPGDGDALSSSFDIFQILHCIRI